MRELILWPGLPPRQSQEWPSVGHPLNMLGQLLAGTFLSIYPLGSQGVRALYNSHVPMRMLNAELDVQVGS
jgi:hypothetical protein